MCAAEAAIHFDISAFACPRLTRRWVGARSALCPTMWMIKSVPSLRRSSAGESRISEVPGLI